MFVSEIDTSLGTSYVHRYQFVTNFTVNQKPTLSISKHDIIYNGTEVSALCIDDSDHSLFIADSGAQSISMIDYSNKSSEVGKLETLYNGIEQVKNLKGLTCDHDS